MTTRQRIKLSSKQADAFRLLEKPDYNHVSEVFYGGAAGGGKSWFGCFWQIYRRLNYAGTRGMIGRSQLKNLKQTTLKTFFDVAGEYFKLEAEKDYKYKSQEGLIKFSNGSEIILKDLFLYPSDPDFASLGSLEITDVFIDEASEITLKAFEIVQSRIRYKVDKVGGTPKVLLTSNPAHNWLKFRYVMTEQNEPVELQPYQRFIPAMVEDNPNEDFKTLYKSQLNKLNKYDRARLLHGDWVVNKNDHPFFYEFSRDRHVQKCYIDADEELWLSFDFNINPTSCLISQKIQGKGLFHLTEVQQKGGTEALCNKLIELGYHKYFLKVTGDFSGNTGNTAAGQLPGGQFVTDFHIIKSKLNLTDFSLIDTRSANKLHEYSRRLSNTILARIPTFIDPSCAILINDLETAEPTPQGKLKKDRDRHKQDMGDCKRYQDNAWFLDGVEGVNRFQNLLI